MTTAQNQSQREPDLGIAAVTAAIGRIIWTFFAFVVLVIGWAALTGFLLRTHQAWGYAIAAIGTLFFIIALAGLRTVWRDGRYW
jgi:hypothetical protein